MNPIKKFGALTSSVDSNKLSTTVQGVILGASVLIIFVAQKFGINLGTADVSNLAVEAGSIISTIAILYGLIQKVVVLFTPVQTPPTVQVVPSDSLPPIQG